MRSWQNRWAATRSRSGRTLMLAVSLAVISVTAAAQETGRWVEHPVDSDCLAGNLPDFPSTRSVMVYLPPGYDEDVERHYPTVYVLHGIGGSNAEFTCGLDPAVDLRVCLDREIGAGRIPPFLYVVPHSGVWVGGCFYTDSEVAGDWESFLVEEVLGLVEDEYRALERSESRGLLGHSMGGYGVLQLGRKYPDTFGAVYAMSPAVLSFTEDLTPENPSWRRALTFRSWEQVRRNPDFYSYAFLCMVLSFSPNSDRAPLCVDWPYRLNGDEIELVPDVMERWHSFMPCEMEPQEREGFRRLRALRIDVGQQEQFPHILSGSRRLAAQLQEADIPYELMEYEGDHNNRIWERIQVEAVPFFARHLVRD